MSSRSSKTSPDELDPDELAKAQGGGIGAASTGGTASPSFTVGIGSDVFNTANGDTSINDLPLTKPTKR